MGPEGGTRLPTPVSELVDRDAEIAEVSRLLRTSRLITLTGPGGIGKTRLAIAVARAASDTPAFADGGTFVQLAPTSAADLVTRTVAVALDIAEIVSAEADDADLEAMLISLLRQRNLLLVLDNCEHQLEATAALALSLLTSCRDLTVLATSREPLGVPGETVWAVPPLSHPATVSRSGCDRTAEAASDRGEPAVVADAEWASQFGAVRLFVVRAGQASRGFRLTDENAGTIASICRRLDGVPLALELAAARVRALSVAEIETRLSDRFALLSGPFRFAEKRHRTLRTSVEWSHQLLTEPEQELFSAMSVFSGGWTLAAAEALVPDALEPLTRLVDKSLVNVEPTPTGPRYSMLETIRAFAADELERAGQTAKLRSAHADYFLELAEAVSPLFYGPGQTAAFAVIDAELNNIRAAGRWSMDSAGCAEQVLRFTAALWDFYCCRCHLTEGLRFARGALALADAAGLTGPSTVRARAFLGIGALLQLQGDTGTTGAVLKDAIDTARACGDLATESYALRLLSMNNYLNGDPEGDAALLTDRAIATATACGDLWLRAFAGHTLAVVNGATRDGPDGVPAPVWQLTEQTGDRRLLAYLRVIAAFPLLGGPRCENTIAMLNAAYRDFHHVGDRYGRLLALSTRLHAESLWGAEQGLTALMIGKCEAAYTGIGSGPLTMIGAGISAAAATARAAIGHGPYGAALLAGAQMTWDELARLLVDLERVAGEAAAADGEDASGRTALPALSALTPREHEIATQVALGLTNRRIASDLVISERTVDTHVQRILAKLQLANRVQLATLMAGRQE